MVAYRQVYRGIILSDENKRPNANYNLSYPDGKKYEGDEKITFYYNRERRLASAPKEVQDLYKEQKPNRFSLFGVLVADKPRKFLFLIIVLFCAAILLLSRIGFFDSNTTLDENKLEIKGLFVEDNTYIIINKTVRSEKAYTGSVDITVSVPSKPSENEYPAFRHRVYFSLEKEESYRFAVPYNEPELLIVLQSDKSEVQYKFKPE
jgi:hypothetical protein